MHQRGACSISGKELHCNSHECIVLGFYAYQSARVTFQDLMTLLSRTCQSGAEVVMSSRTASVWSAVRTKEHCYYKRTHCLLHVSTLFVCMYMLHYEAFLFLHIWLWLLCGNPGRWEAWNSKVYYLWHDPLPSGTRLSGVVLPDDYNIHSWDNIVWPHLLVSDLCEKWCTEVVVKRQ